MNVNHREGALLRACACSRLLQQQTISIFLSITKVYGEAKQLVGYDIVPPSTMKHRSYSALWLGA
jgi:hypothetical protein